MNKKNIYWKEFMQNVSLKVGNGKMEKNICVELKEKIMTFSLNWEFEFFLRIFAMLEG